MNFAFISHFALTHQSFSWCISKPIYIFEGWPNILLFYHINILALSMFLEDINPAAIVYCYIYCCSHLSISLIEAIHFIKLQSNIHNCTHLLWVYIYIYYVGSICISAFALMAHICAICVILYHCYSICVCVCVYHLTCLDMLAVLQLHAIHYIFIQLSFVILPDLRCILRDNGQPYSFYL